MPFFTFSPTHVIFMSLGSYGHCMSYHCSRLTVLCLNMSTPGRDVARNSGGNLAGVWECILQMRCHREQTGPLWSSRVHKWSCMVEGGQECGHIVTESLLLRGDAMPSRLKHQRYLENAQENLSTHSLLNVPKNV